MFRRIRYYIINNWQKVMLTSIFILLTSALLLTISTTKVISAFMLERIKKNLGAEVSLNIQILPNMTIEEFEATSRIDSTVLETIASDSRIKLIKYPKSVGVVAENMNFIEHSGHSTYIPGLTTMINIFWLVSASSPEIQPSITDKINLVSGRYFTKIEVEESKAVALISQEVAEKNQLKVGDNIAFRHEITDFDGHNQCVITKEQAFERKGCAKLLNEMPVNLEIVGIIQPKVLVLDQSLDEIVQESILINNAHVQNDIYVPEGIIDQLNMFSKSEAERLGLWWQPQSDFLLPTYVLESPDDVEPFIETYLEMVGPNYTFYSNMKNFERLVAPLGNVETITDWFMRVIIVIYLLVLIALCWNYSRDRRKETAILLALGEKRTEIIAQLSVELSLIASIGIVFGILLSSIIGPTIVGTIISRQYSQVITESGYDTAIEFSQMGLSGIEIREIVKEASVLADIKFVLLLLSITILIVTIINIIYIYRLSPRKILIE